MIKAAGLILAKHVEGELYLLLQNRLRKGRMVYEDFGGRMEESDASPLETILREASEESNGLLNCESLKQRIDAGYYSEFYHQKGKYLFLVVLATEEEKQIKDFGKKELYSKIERHVQWIKSSDLRKEILCERLHVNSFTDQLSILKV
jgi:hypothetical protein